MRSRSVKITVSAVLMLVGVLILSFICNSMLGYITIENSGKVLTGETPITQKSEIRGVFVHCATWNDPSKCNWTLIARTCQSYGINLVMGEFLTISGGYYNSSIAEVVGGAAGDQLGQAIAACHPLGIQVWVSMDVLLGSPNSSMAVIDSTGRVDTSWTNPSNPMTQAWIKSLVQELVTRYAIDGFNFDYIRYNSENMDYGNYSQTQFINDTGMTSINWPSDVAPNANYHSTFMQWRITQITKLVANMRSWMLAINLKLKFSASVFAPWDAAAPQSWTYWIGQDSADWVAKGYLDIVCPMIYTNETGIFNTTATVSANTFNGGFNGQIPFVPLISDCQGSISSPATTSAFAAIVNMTRRLSCKGWIVWAYGGPGCSYNFPDIRSYLGNTTFPETFAVSNLAVDLNLPSQATLTWITTQSLVGRVEYSTTPLFTENMVYSPVGEIYYSVVNYVAGTTLQETSNTTNHSITIVNATKSVKYYYRVISTNVNGIVTLLGSFST